MMALFKLRLIIKESLADYWTAWPSFRWHLAQGLQSLST